jgi:drug/metabolite transporter (DMT)-like permease
VLAVLTISQTAGLLIALVLFPLIGADDLPAEKLLVAAGAGAAAIFGLGAFYRAMAMGTMSIVAPIAALGVVIPVAVGLAKGEEPGAVSLFGLILGIVGVVVLSREEGRDEERAPEQASVARRSILLALVAAVGFGLFFTALDSVATDRPGWAITAARVGGVVVILAALLATRTSLRGVGASMPTLFAIGVFDITANTLFAVAATKGLLPIVAVGGSMYPVFTIALAHMVLGERLGFAQRVGVALALLGVLLIAAGSA